MAPSSTMAKAQQEVFLRTAVTNIRIHMETLRRLPFLDAGDSMLDALQAMEAAIYNLHQYADKAGLAVQPSMKT